MPRYFTYRTALWIFFVSLISYLVIILGVVVKTDAIANLAQGSRYLVYMFLDLLLLFPLYIYVKINKESVKHFFYYRKVKKLYFVYLLFISFGMFLMLLSVDYLCYMRGLKEINLANDMILTYEWNIIPLIILSGFVTPIVEEFVFRGFLIRIMRDRHYSPLIIIIVSSLIFSLAHLNSASLINIFLAGIILGLVAYSFHSIIPSIIIHSIFNTLALFEINIPQIRDSVISGSILLPMALLLLGTLLLALGLSGVKKNVHIHHKRKEKRGVAYEK